MASPTQRTDLPADSQQTTELDRLAIVYSPVEERFDRLARIAARVFGVETASISLLAERELWFRSRHGLRLSDAPRRDDFVAMAILAEGPLVVPDATLDPRFALHANGDAPRARFLAGMALRSPDGASVGTLTVTDPRPRTLAKEEVALLCDLASIVEDELRHMELTSAQGALLRELDEARRRSMIDPLTQAWNRAGLDELLRREIELATKLGHPFAVAMIDIDHFKQINDTYGHAIGDGVLVEFADRLRIAARPGDAVSRFGGEEFVVVLSGCSPEDAPMVADRLRRRVAAEAFSVGGGVLAALTCSAGVSSWLPNERPDVLLMRADIALYDAKRGGRNRVSIATPPRDGSGEGPRL